MQLPTQILPPTMVAPQTLILFGPSKIGKTTMLSKLPECLIVDTEQGSKYLSALKVNVSSLNDLRELHTALSAPGAPRYKYLAIDVIDSVADWVEAAVVAENKVAVIGDIPYGGGYSIVRERIIAILNAFKPLTDHLIIIGHRKKTVIGSDKLEFSASSLDLTGKLKNLLMSDADAIGYVYREEKGNLMVSFKPTEEVEAGSRCEHLKGKIFEFNWETIYPKGQ